MFFLTFTPAWAAASAVFRPKDLRKPSTPLDASTRLMSSLATGRGANGFPTSAGSTARPLKSPLSPENRAPKVERVEDLPKPFGRERRTLLKPLEIGSEIYDILSI